MFSLANDLYFGRRQDGTVRVIKFNSPPLNFPHIDDTPDKNAVLDVHIPPEQWASVIAAVSLGGETSESYLVALDFHAGRFNASGI